MGSYTLGKFGGQKWQAGCPDESHDHQHRDNSEHNFDMAPELTAVGSWCESARPPRAKWEDDTEFIAPSPAPHRPSASPTAGPKRRPAYVSDEPPLQGDDSRADFDRGPPHQDVRDNQRGRLWHPDEDPALRPQPRHSSYNRANVAANHPSRLSQSGPQTRSSNQSSNWRDDSTELIKEPETRPISQEQLVAEVKAIYAGLVMVEKKCLEIDNAQNTWSDLDDAILGDERWRTRNHVFLLPAANHPLASLALKCPVLKHRKTETEPLSTLDLIYHFISKLGQGAHGELLRLVQMTEDILDRLYKRFWRADFETLVYLLLLYRFFDEFPSGIRHLCTTMPWTIWPALVVLWGVCWMFIQNQASPREDPSLLPRQPQRERDLDADVDLSAICEASDGFSSLYGFGSPDLTTSHPTFMEREFSALPVHDSFRESYLSSDLLTMLSNQDIFPALSASPNMNPASLVTTSPHQAPLASNPMIGSTQSSANQNSNWNFQHLDPATSFAQNRNTHNPSEVGRDVIQSAPNRTLRTNGALSARADSFTCPDCAEQFDRKDIFRRHKREQKHGEFAGSDRPEFRCPNPQCRKSAEGNGFRRQDKLLEHLRNKSCKPDRRLSKARHRFTSNGPPAVLSALSARPHGLNHDDANAVGSPTIGRDDASDTPSDETSSPGSASAVPVSDVRISVPPPQLDGGTSIRQTQRKTPSVEEKSADGKPTLSERIGFHEKCYEADVDELNVTDKEIQAMEEALHAKRQARQQVEERVVTTREVLEMLKRQLEGIPASG
ncbi:hypothetical protein B0H66DRAFT_592224 [Apodospora peruviana]|uniref:C2H2-type domain-containing protein n=1 Tax=Apodospora peruviana TaxID=516989 RepID=A0AAE0M2X0_9PEZI|nr:hypothetical protein B0H66DRAFT_592224 [Apodospora peruviana]